MMLIHSSIGKWLYLFKEFSSWCGFCRFKVE